MNHDTVNLVVDQNNEVVRKVLVEGHHHAARDRQYDDGRRG